MTLDNQSLSDMQRAIRDAYGAHWRLMMFQGVVMIILGVIAVAAPAIATIAIDIWVGWLFLFSGVIGLIALFSSHHIPAFLWSLITAALSFALGVLLIWKPVEGALSLTFVLTAFFLVEGVFQIATSLVYRESLPGTWGWMLASGVSDLLLVLIIVLGWPATGIWVLGLLVGFNLLMSGWAIVMMGFAGRQVTKTGTDSTPAHQP
ncbi:MAG TPA: HdeD family acid-resistance protein [Methylocystis sp.]|jgi:uncharacterized membrane protein HdeD (DUF308 family)